MKTKSPLSEWESSEWELINKKNDVTKFICSVEGPPPISKDEPERLSEWMKKYDFPVVKDLDWRCNYNESERYYIISPAFVTEQFRDAQYCLGIFYVQKRRYALD